MKYIGNGVGADEKRRRSTPASKRHFINRVDPDREAINGLISSARTAASPCAFGLFSQKPTHSLSLRADLGNGRQQLVPCRAQELDPIGYFAWALDFDNPIVVDGSPVVHRAPSRPHAGTKCVNEPYTPKFIKQKCTVSYRSVRKAAGPSSDERGHYGFSTALASAWATSASASSCNRNPCATAFAAARWTAAR